MALRRSPNHFLPHRASEAPAEMIDKLIKPDKPPIPLHLPLAVSDTAAGVFPLLHHGMFHELLLTGEDPAQWEALVRQSVHQCWIGMCEERLEQLIIRPGPSSGQPGFLWFLGLRG